MPNWTSAAAFARDLERTQREIDREGALEINKAAAREAQVIGYREAARDLGGDPKFSGWPPWLELQTVVRRNGVLLRPTRRSAGPWTVANVGRNRGSGTGGAFLGPGASRTTGETRRRKDGSVAKVREFRSRRWNGYTRGFGTADRAVRVMDDKIPDGIEREFGKLLRKRFDVS